MENFFQNNWVDLLFVAMIVFFALSAHGLVATFLEILSLIFSLIFSYRFFTLFGSLVMKFTHTTKGIADAAGFFIAWSLIEMILYFLIYLFSNKYLSNIHRHPINRKLGFLAGMLQGAFIYLFLISVIFALPVRGNIKNAILVSKVGPFFVNASQSLQLQSKSVFGGAVTEALNFLTIKPHSNETVEMDFKLKPSQESVDRESEKKMVELVNQERVKVGLGALQRDDDLTVLARSYAKVMFENGFFSHVSQVDGYSPGERADAASIEYMVLGENLA
ncbi:MAG: CvpA family protein, partial [Patescibacteria group bacterium]